MYPGNLTGFGRSQGESYYIIALPFANNFEALESLCEKGIIKDIYWHEVIGNFVIYLNQKTLACCEFKI